MPERFQESIVNFLSAQNGQTIRVAELADQLNIALDDRQAFEQAVEELAKAGRVVWGSGRMIALPAMGNRVVGIFRQTSRGFGFVIPDEPNSHGDLFIPAGENLDAITGDFVAAKVVVREKYDMRDPRKAISGRIIEVLKRGTNRAVGTLTQQHGRWLVVPDGNVFKAPIEVQDAKSKSANEGDKVVVELLTFPGADVTAQGVITEVLGAHGEPEVELQSVIRQYDLPREFPAAVLEQARKVATQYDPREYGEREDITDQVIATIDPVDARDFDDAISLKVLKGGATNAHATGNDDMEAMMSTSGGAGPAAYELGVHIADVSAFVPPESPLDMEARARGNSTYFPRYVIPMLPEVLSNGVCSLQEGQPRLTKSAFIRYDARGHVVGTRCANTIIRSRKRLTYEQAQAIIDDAKGEGQPFSKGLLEAPINPNVPQVEPAVRDLLLNMDRLARVIRQRRLEQGMIVLDLPEVELVMDETGHVVDAKPEDNSFTHKIIEMFMVEANEAVARFLTKNHLAVLRRVHPDPDVLTAEQVRQFVQIAGKKVPKVLDRHALQELIDSVRGTPISYAVHLSILKTFTTAEYSPLALGHYALASDNYAHFTSPIRRYADLVIHRGLDAVLTQARKKKKHAPKSAHAVPAAPPAVPSGLTGQRRGAGMMPETLGHEPDYSVLVQLGKHLSYTERRSSDAERELRSVKVLQLLAEHVGDVIDGVVTGVTGFGVFVQSTRFLVEGMIRIGDLPDDFWQFDDRIGVLRGQRTGRRIALGDRAKVQIVSVNIPARQLEFRLLEHGSSIGGETTMRRVAAPGKLGQVIGSDTEDQRDLPGRKKNLDKRQARKEAARQQAARRAAGGGGPGFGHTPQATTAAVAAAKAVARAAEEEDKFERALRPISAGEIAMLFRYLIIRTFGFDSSFEFRHSSFLLLSTFYFLLSAFTFHAQAETRIISGPMIGHVSDTSARLWMQLNTTEDVSVRVIDMVTNRPMGGVRAGVEGPAPFIFDAPLVGLAPNQTYRVEIFFDGKPVTPPGPDVIIRTPPAPGESATFSVAFGSGISPAVDPKLPILKTVQSLHPRAFFMLGNAGYLPANLKDWPVTRKLAAGMLYQFYQNVRTTPDLQPLLRTTALYATWGEHDFGVTGADRNFPFAKESRAAFMRFWPNPDYGTADCPGIFCAVTIGDADFFLLDSRTFRDPDGSPKAFFGHDQIQWLQTQLAASRAKFKIIASAEQFLPAYSGSQGWAHDPHEQQPFIQWLWEKHIDGVVLISGDRRFGELNLRPPTATNPSEYPLYELTSSPLGVDVADDNAQHEPNPLRQGPLISVPNFGTLDFGGPKGQRHLTLRLRDALGKVLLEKVLFTGELTSQ